MSKREHLISDWFLPGETKSDFYRRRKAWNEDLIAWAGEVLDIHSHMGPEDRAELDAWEAEFVSGDGGSGSFDWPGWTRLARPRPRLERPFEQSSRSKDIR